MRHPVCGLIALIMGFCGTVPAQDREQRPATRETDEAYLLGMIGAAHVFVLHDYVALLEERAETGTDIERTVQRLSFVVRHCNRLSAELNVQTEPAVAPPDGAPPQVLAELFKLVRDEAAALQRRIENPTRENGIAFREAQAAVAARIELLRSSENDEE